MWERPLEGTVSPRKVGVEVAIVAPLLVDSVSAALVKTGSSSKRRHSDRIKSFELTELGLGERDMPSSYASSPTAPDGSAEPAQWDSAELLSLSM